jgi:glycosyltransferase involved in cell wall biosynthesis
VLHTESSPGLGGQEIRTLDEARWISESGWRVVLACQAGGRLQARAAEAGLEAVAVRMRGAWDVGALRRLVRLIGRQSISIVHTHSSVDGWLGGMAARLAGVPVVRTRHVSIPIRRGWNPVYAQLADRVVTSGEAIRALVIGAGVPADRVVAIPAGVRLEDFTIPAGVRLEDFTNSAAGAADDFTNSAAVAADDFANSAAGAADDFTNSAAGAADDFNANGRPAGAEAVAKELRLRRPVIGSVAMFRGSKGHAHLLDAFAVVRRAFPDARLLLVGDGIRRQWVEELARDKGLGEAVVFTGFRADVPALLATMDCFALASTRTEGVPQSLLQAFAAGVPVVASSIGGIPEIVEDGVTGLLVPPEDPAALATAIQAVLGQPAAAAERAAAARRLVEARFSHRAAVGRLLALYEELLSGGPSVAGVSGRA